MQDLFSKCGQIYVCEGTAPPTKNLVDLITLCGGQVSQINYFLEGLHLELSSVSSNMERLKPVCPDLSAPTKSLILSGQIIVHIALMGSIKDILLWKDNFL